jgi:hypothetical protein
MILGAVSSLGIYLWLIALADGDSEDPRRSAGSNAIHGLLLHHARMTIVAASHGLHGEPSLLHIGFTLQSIRETPRTQGRPLESFMTLF